MEAIWLAKRVDAGAYGFYFSARSLENRTLPPLLRFGRSERAASANRSSTGLKTIHADPFECARSRNDFGLLPMIAIIEW